MTNRITPIKRDVLVVCLLALFYVAVSVVSPALAATAGPDPLQPFLPVMSDACVPNFTHEQWVKPPLHIVNSVKDGNWSDSTVWDAPLDANAVIRIKHNVTFDTDATVYSVGIYSNATLTFATSKTMTLKLVDLIVHAMGTLQIGTVSQPVDPHVVVTIVFRDVAINTSDKTKSFLDPGQYGNGLLVFGALRVHGSLKNATFVRLTKEPKTGDASLSMEQGVSGWNVGDHLLIPDSRNLAGDSDVNPYSPRMEQVTLQSIAGNTISFSPALRFDHPGARNAQGKLEFFPHVANLTRNVIFQSENDNGIRGHSIFFERADIDVRYAAFNGLGRTVSIDNDSDDGTDSAVFDNNCNATKVGTNQIGRYPVHCHHLIGVSGLPASQPQFVLQGNEIDGNDSGLTQDRRWSMAIHGSHYGLVTDNVMYRMVGAGLVTEDGSESYNHIERNFACRILGGGNRNNKGNDGVAFWFRGPNNYVNDNVATDVNPQGIYSYGYAFAAVYLGNIVIPAYKGAMPGMSGEGTIVDGNSIPLLQFERNEIYGATPDGMTVWWLGTYGTEPRGTAGRIADLRVWHCHKWGFFGYPTNLLTITNYVVRCDKNVTYASPYDLTQGMWFADYDAKKTVIINPNIQGCSGGIDTPLFAGIEGSTLAVTTIQGGYLDNKTNISDDPPSSVNGSGGLPPKRLIIRNVELGSDDAIVMSNTVFAGGGTPNLSLRDDIFVFNYDKPIGQTGPNLYLIPKGRPSNTCDSTVADCSQELSSQYPQIKGALVYKLIASDPGSGNAPPSVVTAAQANPNPVTGTTASLSVLGADTDGAGEPALMYSWSVIGIPPAAVAFSKNNSNDAKNVTATFSKSGSYTLRATIQDVGGLSVTSDVNVTVNQTLTTITVAPSAVSVQINTTKSFSANQLDQFGNVMATAQPLVWTASGGGSIASSGLFLAGSAAGGPFTITAAVGAIRGAASVTIAANTPPAVNLITPGPNTSYQALATIPMSASVAANTGVSITKVEFFEQTTRLGQDSSSPYTFSWTNVPAGNYEVYARATDSNNEVGESAHVLISVIAPVSVPPGVPTGLMASAGDQQVTLTWNSNSETDLAGYLVYSSLSANGPFTLLNNSPILATQYTQTGLQNNVPYYYAVAAENTSGQVSAMSAAQQAIPHGGVSGVNSTRSGSDYDVIPISCGKDCGQIQFTSSYSDIVVNVYNTLGKKMKEMRVPAIISSNDFRSGTYMAVFHKNGDNKANGSAKRKFVVIH